MPLRRSHKQHFCPGVPINRRPVATRPGSVHKQTVSTELARLGRSYRPGLKSTSGGSLTLTSRRPGEKTRAFRGGGGRSSSAQSGKSRVTQSGPSLNFESFLLWRSRDRCRRHLLSVCVCGGGVGPPPLHVYFPSPSHSGVLGFRAEVCIETLQ